MAQTMKRIRQYPGTDVEKRKKYMDAATEMVQPAGIHGIF